MEPTQMNNDPGDPAAMIRSAWCELRLNALQQIVEAVIDDLRALELQGARMAPPRASSFEFDGSELDPVFAALEACSEELREESGALGASERRLEHARMVCATIGRQPQAWSASFREALVDYRLEAARRLHVVLPGARALAHEPAHPST